MLKYVTMLPISIICVCVFQSWSLGNVSIPSYALHLGAEDTSEPKIQWKFPTKRNWIIMSSWFWGCLDVETSHWCRRGVFWNIFLLSHNEYSNWGRFPKWETKIKRVKTTTWIFRVENTQFFLGGEQIILTPKLPDFNVCLSYVKFKDSAKKVPTK